MHLRAARQASAAPQGTTEVTEGAVSSTAEVLSTTAASTQADGGAAGTEGGGGGNSSSLNVTAHFLDDDADDYGLSEMQTVALACIATLIPLFFILVAAFAVRFVWRKFRARRAQDASGEAGGGARGYDGILQRDESAEAAKAGAPGGGTSTTGSGAQLLLLDEQMKTSESQFSVTPGELEEVTSQSPLIGGASAKGSNSSNHRGSSKSANGNVITMTLQNNHLIVETEELASLPMVDDVEPSPPPAAASPLEDTAQIHAPPPSVDFRRAAPEEDLLEDEEGGGDQEGTAEEVRKDESEEEGGGAEEEGGQAGLSQSDLSDSSSIGSSNPTYRYGNQLGYAAGHFGYPQYAGYEAPRVTSAARADEDGGKKGGGWLGEAVNGETAGDDEEERRHQRVQEQLGGAEVTSYAPGHHRTASLPKAADDIAALGAGANPDSEKIRCSKRRSLPIITHAPTTTLGGFKKLLNEEEGIDEERGVTKGGEEGREDGEVEVSDKAAPQSRIGSDNAALKAGDAGTNSGEHENEAFVETD